MGTGQCAKFTRDRFYDRSFTSEPVIEKYQAKPAISNEKSTWQRRYVKVRRVTKNDCKLNTKRVRLNKVSKNDKKYLLNWSVRVYQRIIKLKYKASR